MNNKACKNCNKLRDGHGKFAYLFPKDLLDHLFRRLFRGDSNTVTMGIGISGGLARGADETSPVECPPSTSTAHYGLYRDYRVSSSEGWSNATTFKFLISQ